MADRGASSAGPLTSGGDGAERAPTRSTNARAGRVGGLVQGLLPPLLFAALVLGGWQFFATIGNANAITLPRPSQIAIALWQDRGLLASNGLITVQEIAIGYAAALMLGIGLGWLLTTARVVERAVYPWLVVSQMVPTVAIAPLFVLWTGFDLRPKVLVIILVSFFPLVVNTIDGLKAVEPELVGLLRTMGAGRVRIFRSAQFPAALPSIFSGMKVAAASSVIGAVFGEWVGSSSGLGYLILTFNNQTATPEVFAAVAVLSAIGIALFGAVSVLERLLLPWYHGPRG